MGSSFFTTNSIVFWIKPISDQVEISCSLFFLIKKQFKIWIYSFFASKEKFIQFLISKTICRTPSQLKTHHIPTYFPQNTADNHLHLTWYNTLYQRIASRCPNRSEGFLPGTWFLLLPKAEYWPECNPNKWWHSLCLTGWWVRIFYPARCKHSPR